MLFRSRSAVSLPNGCRPPDCQSILKPSTNSVHWWHWTSANWSIITSRAHCPQSLEPPPAALSPLHPDISHKQVATSFLTQHPRESRIFSPQSEADLIHFEALGHVVPRTREWGIRTAKFNREIQRIRAMMTMAEGLADPNCQAVTSCICWQLLPLRESEATDPGLRPRLSENEPTGLNRIRR